ncbi:MAG: hypothetical protein QF704_10785, partial [Anaerolineales bacterium]|nr:hypothetical protein [Anaerolineales bacterium]
MAIFKGDAKYLTKALMGIIRGMVTLATIVLSNFFRFLDALLNMLGVFGKALTYVVGPVCIAVKYIIEGINDISIFGHIDAGNIQCPKIGGRRLLDVEHDLRIQDVMNVSWEGGSYCDMFMQTATRHGLTLEQLDKSPSDAAGTIDCLRRRAIGETIHSLLKDAGIRTFPVSFFYDPWTAAGWTFNVTRGIVMWTTHSIPALVGRHHIMWDRLDSDITDLHIDVSTTRAIIYAFSKMMQRGWNNVGNVGTHALHELMYEWDPDYKLPTSSTLTAQMYQLHKRGKHVSQMIKESNIDLPQTIADTAAGVHVLTKVAVRSIHDKARNIPLAFAYEKTKHNTRSNEHIADYVPVRLPKMSLMTQSTCTANQREHIVCIGCAVVDNFIWDMFTYANHTHTFFIDNCTGTKATLNERLYDMTLWFENGTIQDPSSTCESKWNNRALDNFPTSSAVRIVHDISATEIIRQFLTVTNDTYIPWVGHSLYYWTENVLSKCDVSSVFCQKRRDLP